MISPLTAHLVGMEKFPSGLSIMLVTNIIAVFGSDIASAIEGQVNSPPFFSYKMFAGVAYALASIMLSILKFRVNRNPFRKV
jgi:hypothetical protein